MRTHLLKTGITRKKARRRFSGILPAKYRIRRWHPQGESRNTKTQDQRNSTASYDTVNPPAGNQRNSRQTATRQIRGLEVRKTTRQTTTRRICRPGIRGTARQAATRRIHRRIPQGPVHRCGIPDRDAPKPTLRRRGWRSAAEQACSPPR